MVSLKSLGGIMKKQRNLLGKILKKNHKKKLKRLARKAKIKSTFKYQALKGTKTNPRLT